MLGLTVLGPLDHAGQGFAEDVIIVGTPQQALVAELDKG